MEQKIRDAARSLATAINDAVAAGYRVEWPSNAAGLDSIAISETAAVKPAPAAQAALEQQRPTSAVLTE